MIAGSSRGTAWRPVGGVCAAALLVSLPALTLLVRSPEALLAACGTYGYTCNQPACGFVQISTDGGYTWRSGSVWIYGPSGTTIDLYVRTTLTLNVSGVEGWSLGVRHSAPTLQPGVNGGSFTLRAVAAGPQIGQIQGGGPPDFQSTRLWTCGLTQGVVVDYGGVHEIGPTSNLVTTLACYRVTIPSGYGAHTVTIAFAPDVGVPAVANAVSRNGTAVVPCTEPLTLLVYPTTQYTPTYSYCPLSPGQPSSCEPQGGGAGAEATPEQMVRKGAEWLVLLQQSPEYPDDRWAYYVDNLDPPPGSSQFYYVLATTAICAEAIVRAPGYSCSTAWQESVRRATEFLIANCAFVCSPANYVEWNWSFFILQYFVCLERLERVPSGLEAQVTEKTTLLVQSIAGCLDATEHKGFPYLGHATTPTDNAAFKTALALKALKEAEEAGYTVGDGWIQGALALHASRIPGEIAVGTVFPVGGPHAGAFTYSDSRLRGEGYLGFDQARATIPGSAGRIPIAETALHRWRWFDHPENPEEAQMTEAQQVERIRRAVSVFLYGQACTVPGEPGNCEETDIWEIYDEVRRTSMVSEKHVPPYGIARYYFLYAHYGVAVAIEQLPEAERPELREALVGKLWDTKEVEQVGEEVYWTWNDQTHSDSKAYGTGIVVLAMLEGLPSEEMLFRRGDANTDRAQDMSDAIFVLLFLFHGGGTPACMDAADSNDDGVVDISDGIHLLTYLFLGGPVPPQPFQERGFDPTEDGLVCGVYPQCDA